MRVLTWILGVLAVLILAGYGFLWAWPLHNPHPSQQLAQDIIAIRDATIYVSPDEPPLEHATVVVSKGRISAVGQTVEVPANAKVLPCSACTVTAGFWNTHVHFTEPKWEMSWITHAETLNVQLADMTSSRGFTTVVDASSDLRGTMSLRRRIESGDLIGPTIYTAGNGIFPANGIPFYVRENTPDFIQKLMPQPATPAEAREIVEKNIRRGGDLVKLFTGSYVTRDRVLPMQEDVAKAAVEVAHAHHQLVFSHPSDLAGTLVAIHSGVDVLAHAPDTTEGIDDAVMKDMIQRKMTMVPTLKMFATTVTTKSAYLQPIYDEVRRFHELGGELMFGTDVGYMTDYSTEGEYEGLVKSGLNAMDILRMLTTTPARRFGVLKDRGTVTAGKIADLVVLASDPAQDTAAFARVRTTIHNGRIIFSKTN